MIRARSQPLRSGSLLVGRRRQTILAISKRIRNEAFVFWNQPVGLTRITGGTKALSKNGKGDSRMSVGW